MSPSRAPRRGVEDSVAELLAALRSSDGMVAACRLVSHVTTSDGAPVDLLGVHIVPAEFRGGIFEEIASTSPAATAHSTVTIPGRWPSRCRSLPSRTAASTAIRSHTRSTARFSRFLRLIRLLYASTSQSIYEIRGETHAGPSAQALLDRLQRFPRTRSADRPALISDEPALAGLGRLLDALNVSRRTCW